jgi:hypothetical protein
LLCLFGFCFYFLLWYYYCTGDTFTKILTIYHSWIHPALLILEMGSLEIFAPAGLKPSQSHPPRYLRLQAWATNLRLFCS